MASVLEICGGSCSVISGGYLEAFRTTLRKPFRDVVGIGFAFEMEGEEIYLGGIVSPELIVGGFRGCGVHATNKRLILTRTRPVMSGAIFGMFGGALLGTEKSGGMRGRAAAMKLRQLERMKSFEVSKADTMSLELKAPGRERFSNLKIIPREGEPVEVGVTSVKDFQFIKELMTRFCPQVLDVV